MIILIDINNDQCVGCGVCVVVCPKFCISMHENEYGEYRPFFINKIACINCGQCEDKCVAFDPQIIGTHIEKCFFGYASEENIQKSSSSGGIFFEIAREFINKGGCVIGAAFDSNWTVKHIIAKNEKTLKMIQGSKYCESQIYPILSDIQKILLSGKKVLFSGVPCQIGALKQYLGKNYDNLFTCEVFCHGAPRIGVFRKYCQIIEKKYGKISSFDFRSKEYGWDDPSYKIVTQKKIIIQKHKRNLFQLMFGYHHSLRKSCLNCAFRSKYRQADISLGDFWGIDKYYVNIDRKNQGISAIIVNSNKGNKLLEKCGVVLNSCTSDEIFDKNKWQIMNFPNTKGYDQFNKDYVHLPNSIFFIRYYFKYHIFDKIKRRLMPK